MNSKERVSMALELMELTAFTPNHKVSNLDLTHSSDNANQESDISTDQPPSPDVDTNFDTEMTILTHVA